MKTIYVEVIRGCANVMGVPKNIRVVVKDYDVLQGGDGLKADEEGWEYREEIFLGASDDSLGA